VESENGCMERRENDNRRGLENKNCPHLVNKNNSKNPQGTGEVFKSGEGQERPRKQKFTNNQKKGDVKYFFLRRGKQ